MGNWPVYVYMTCMDPLMCSSPHGLVMSQTPKNHAVEQERKKMMRGQHLRIAKTKVTWFTALRHTGSLAASAISKGKPPPTNSNFLRVIFIGLGSHEVGALGPQEYVT